MNKLIITCAITGAETTKEQNPALPTTPDEQAQASLLDQIGNVMEDRSSEDLLFQVLLDWGVDLALPITREMIHDKEVFFVDENALAACFDVGLDEDFVKDLAKRKPLRAVFRDACYPSDDIKINIESISNQFLRERRSGRSNCQYRER